MIKIIRFFTLFLCISAIGLGSYKSYAACEGGFTQVDCSSQPTQLFLADNFTEVTNLTPNPCCLRNCIENAQLSGTECICSPKFFQASANACELCPAGYGSDAGATSDNDCFKSCTKPCTSGVGCPANATCTWNTGETTTGTENYGGSCNAADSNCSVKTKTCNSGYYGDPNNSNACNECTNPKPTGATYNGNSTTNNCPWGNVAIPIGKYYQSKEISFQPCPTGKYCAGGKSVNSDTTEDVGITGDCEKPTDATFTAGQTGASTPTGCPWNAVCGAGNYWNYSGKKCDPCKKGYYCGGISISEGTSSDQGLTPCGAGKTTEGTGSTEARACKYVTGNGGTKFCDNGNNCFYLP